MNFPIKYNLEDGTIYIPILVDDIPKAKSFYGDVFGFTPAFEEAEELGWSELHLPIKNVRLGLDLVEELPNNRNPRDVAFCLSVQDIDETKKYLESKNVKTTDIRDIPNMVSLMDCWDPFENLIQIMAAPRGSTD